MALKTRVEPINRDIELMLKETLSPAAQSKQFAQFAGEQIEDAKKTNRTILGRVPRMMLTVDGKMNAPLASVRPNGVVIAEFELLTDTLAWIGEQLVKHSPVGKSGTYKRSHVLLADGVEIDVGKVIPEAEVYTFINGVPYARKIEKGSSSQAPSGVYQAVATLASGRFGNVAKISFSYQSLKGGAVGKWSQSASAQRHAAANRSHSGSSAASRSEWLTRQPAITVRVGKR